jgi:hypothetical protein
MFFFSAACLGDSALHFSPWTMAERGTGTIANEPFEWFLYIYIFQRIHREYQYRVFYIRPFTICHFQEIA